MCELMYLKQNTSEMSGNEKCLTYLFHGRVGSCLTATLLICWSATNTPSNDANSPGLSGGLPDTDRISHSPVRVNKSPTQNN